MDTQDEKELEIDLVELLKEIKKHVPVIIGVTLLCAGIAYFYAFKYQAPEYAMTRIIKLPWRIAYSGLPDQEKRTFAQIFKADIGNAKYWPEPAKGHLSNVQLIMDKNYITNLLQFQFTGTEPEYMKQASQTYMDTATERINAIIKEDYDAAFTQEYFRTVKSEIKNISSLLNNGIISSRFLL